MTEKSSKNPEKNEDKDRETIDRIFKESVSTDTPERKQGVSCQHKGRKEPANGKAQGGKENV